MTAMKEMFRDVINQVMEVDMDEELGREGCQRADPDCEQRPNYRNGYSKKNEIWAGNLPVSPFALSEALSRRKKSKKPRKNWQILGRSIDERPEIVKNLAEFGHWEIDTVIGRKKGHESVVLTLHEMLTGNYLTLKIACRESNAVMAGINVLRKEYGCKFSAVFKTITSDNGKEFSRLSELESWNTSVFFCTSLFFVGATAQ